MTNLQFNDQINDQHLCSVDTVTEESGPPTGPCQAAGRGEAGASSGSTCLGDMVNGNIGIG